VATLEAVLWDVDGTLADTERDGHRVAFNLAFASAGLEWRWDETRYGELLEVTGGRERLLHDMAARDDAPADALGREALARRLHATKNSLYAELVQDGRIPLRPGVRELLRQCRARGVALAIATTTSRTNVGALLGAQLGRDWADWFRAVVCGEDVERKKPDPAVYVEALRRLHVEARAALAIEDSPAGVSAARAAGVPVIVTRSTYFADARIDGALAIGPGLHTSRDWHPAVPEPSGGDRNIGLDDLTHWHTHSRPSGVSQTSHPQETR
jgi:HAD superfamily hydrolase (TIGR01509 family)